MIVDVRFGAPDRGVRTLRFARRSSIPVEAACRVANGLRETLRELLGAACELVIGEPAAIGAEAWTLLTRDAYAFLTRGRRTDVVLVVPQGDARRLVRRAFGEPEGPGAPAEAASKACSALELHAIERIAARCATALEPLLLERTTASRPVAVPDLPACVAYFDVRVHAPLALTLGIGIARDLPDPCSPGCLGAAALDAVGVEARAVFAEGTLSMASFAALRAGDIVKLDTKVGAPACLNVGGRRLAYGVAGVVASRTAFLVHDVALGANP